MNSLASGSRWKPTPGSAAAGAPDNPTAAAIGHGLAGAGTPNGSVRTGPDGDGSPPGGRNGPHRGPDGGVGTGGVGTGTST